MSHPADRPLTRSAVVRGGVLAAAAAAATSPARAVAASSRPRTAAAIASARKQIARATWAITDDPVSLDYAFAYDFNTNPPVTNIAEALLRIDPQGHLHPNLAKSWHAANPTTYVYELRKGVRFHDGTEMTAHDAAVSLGRIGDPKVGAYTSAFYDRVKSIEATGRYELTVKLTRPDAIWPYVVATTAGEVSSAAFLEKHGKKVGTPGVGLIGTGPYRFVSWTKGQQVVLERFEDYWNKARPLAIRQLVFKPIADEATIVSALGTGEVDATFGNSISARSTVSLIKKFPQVKLYRSPSYLVHYLIVNTQRPPFTDPRVRQALSYAIDKNGLLKSVWAGLGKPSKSPAVPPLWTYAQPTFAKAYAGLPAFAPDFDKAKKLIEAAGAQGASAKLLVGTAFEQQLGVGIQAAGAQIGLNLQLDKVPPTQKLGREFSGKTRDYDASVSEWGSDIPDPSGNLILPFYSKDVFTNASQYRNKKMDAILSNAREALSPSKRAQLLTQAQTIAVRDQPWIVFYNPDSLLMMNKRLTGYAMRPLWYWDPWAGDLRGT
jgi:peptide/nickel transport system substrate-binding protein